MLFHRILNTTFLIKIFLLTYLSYTFNTIFVLFTAKVHIFFDDAFRCVKCHASSCVHQENTTNPATQVNDYVLDFVNAVEKCVKARDFKYSPPEKFPALYGGRLLFTLPRETKMYVHLKDKNKIRAKKRWSQVGFRLIYIKFVLCLLHAFL